MIIDVDLTEEVGSPGVWFVDTDDLENLTVKAVVREGRQDWDGLTRALDGIARVDRGNERVHIRSESLERFAGVQGCLSGSVVWDRQLEVEPDHFRYVLGHFPTGVAVLTANRPDGPVGMACNSLTSVSLNPPLIAVCPAKTSETWPEIRQAGRFMVNLVPRQHKETVAAFARKGHDRFAAGAFHPRRSGPALDDAMAWIECVVEVEHDAGDHTLALCRVTALEASHDAEPLVFFRGQYGSFGTAEM